jgi:polysaccharide export outer membrane protein
MKKIKCLLALIALHLAAICAFSAGQESSPASKNIDDTYVIGFEDVLAIDVWKQPELSVKEEVVRPDGKISIPLLGDIHASGCTAKQLRETIAEKLKDYVAAPVVTVTVIRILSKYVSVVGQVSKPGTYTLGSPTSIMELLARAGGLTIDAKSKKILVIRKDGEKTITIPFNYNDMVNGKDLKQNILVISGDLLVIP